MQLQDLPLDDLSPAQLWKALDEPSRREAAEALYEDRETRPEADTAIAAAIHFRSTSVRKLPVAQRIGYLLRAVRPDDSLATSLLLALHLGRRQPLLSAFLDRMGIPHDEGMIDPDHELGKPSAEQLADPVARLYAEFPQDQVEAYLACLLAMDPDSWRGLLDVIRERGRQA